MATSAFILSWQNKTFDSLRIFSLTQCKKLERILSSPSTSNLTKKIVEAKKEFESH